MATCPLGHGSTAGDYCDTCGLAIGGSSAPPVPAHQAEAPRTCAVCRAPLHGRFCEECGHDDALPPSALPPSALPPSALPPSALPPAPPAGPPPPAAWTAVVRADRTWYDEVRRREGPDLERVAFPRFCPERSFELTGPRMAIGRRSRSRGSHPDIDLSGPPLDPGVSAQHALLVAVADGWQVVDLGSTNGTSVGDSVEPIAPHTPVPLADGDRIRLGAWTTITVAVTAAAGGQSR